MWNVRIPWFKRSSNRSRRNMADTLKSRNLMQLQRSRRSARAMIQKGPANWIFASKSISWLWTSLDINSSLVFSFAQRASLTHVNQAVVDCFNNEVTERPWLDVTCVIDKSSFGPWFLGLADGDSSNLIVRFYVESIGTGVPVLLGIHQCSQSSANWDLESNTWRY